MAILRDQEHYIREWLIFHRLIGVERFVLALHKCTDKTKERIRSLPFADDIVIRKYDDAQHVQMSVYAELMRDYRNTTFWMGVWDSDEYMFPVEGDDLKTVLADYENYGSLLVHNYEFGSSNRVLRPQGVSLESFTWRAKDDHWMHRGFKSVIRTDSWQWFCSPHCVQSKLPMVREDHGVLNDDDIAWKSSTKEKPPLHSIIRYNHYYTRSMEDWVQRCGHGDICSDKLPPPDVERFKNRDHRDVEDFTIRRFVPRLKEELAR